MNKTLTILGSFLLLIIISCNDDKKTFKRKNYLKEFSKTKNQTFQLDSVDLIVGKKGTKIYFNISNFNVSKYDTITAKLKEFYTFDELVYNDIHTITDKNELLESSGVIYIAFFKGDKKIALKKGHSVKIEFPEQKLKNNNIYIGQRDAIQGFLWKEEKQKDTIIRINKGTQRNPLIIELEMRKDSIKNYDDIITSTNNNIIALDNFSDSIAFSSKLGWINIDRIITEDYQISFELKSSMKKINEFSCYFIYENLNSFINDYRPKDSLQFKDIKIKGQTFLVILGNDGEDFFLEKINLNELNTRSKIQLNLKKTSKKEFTELLIN